MMPCQKEAKHSRYGKMVKESVAPDSQIGSKVPVFTAKSQDEIGNFNRFVPR